MVTIFLLYYFFSFFLVFLFLLLFCVDMFCAHSSKHCSARPRRQRSERSTVVGKHQLGNASSDQRKNYRFVKWHNYWKCQVTWLNACYRMRFWDTYLALTAQNRIYWGYYSFTV